MTQVPLPGGRTTLSNPQRLMPVHVSRTVWTKIAPFHRKCPLQTSTAPYVSYRNGRRWRVEYTRGDAPIPPPSERPKKIPDPEEQAESTGKQDDGLEPKRKPFPSRRPPWLLLLLVRTINLIVGIIRGVWMFLKRQWWGQMLAFFAVGSFCGRLYLALVKPTGEVLYSDFVTLVETGLVQSARFEQNSDKIYFSIRPEYLTKQGNSVAITLKPQQPESKGWLRRSGSKKAKEVPSPQKTSDPQPGVKQENLNLMVRSIPGQTGGLLELLRTKGVRFGVVSASVKSSLSRVLGTLALLWIPLLPILWLLKRAVSTRTGDKKSRAVDPKAPPVKFADVAGVETAKRELMEVVELLKDPNKYSKLNAKVPSGVLLCGPTGTGKTLLARAVAGEAGVPFFAASASEFVEMFVGRGAARIRELFKEARKNAPCVIFVDEIDSVGGRRGYSLNDERDQTLNQLLVELDGFEGNQGIILLAATNRPDTLDSALLRPGRLTRKINVPLPDVIARAAILDVHLKLVPMQTVEEKADACSFVAKITGGFSGAELANTVNEAALLAAREAREYVLLRDLVKGVERTRRPVDGQGRGGNGFIEGLAKWVEDAASRSQPRPQAGL